MNGIKKNLVLFDLDGVLINSRKNMEAAWATVCDDFNLTIPFENYFSHIGRPFQDILRLIGVNDRFEEVEALYNKASLSVMDEVELYKGAKDYLQNLEKNGVKLWIVTSKESARANKILQKFDVNFSVIRTPDHVCRGKPSPDHILMAIALANVDPVEAIFIGDMDVDYMAANRAGIDYAHARWGYGECNDESVCMLDTFSDIDKCILGDKR